MANTFKFGNGNWAVKDGSVLAYNDENNNFKPLPFDFTRDSIATRVNRDGLIEVVPNNMPRIDFLDNTSGHLLLEPSRTNNVPYSEDFTEWGVTSSGTTLTSNSAISPDGNQTADLLESDSTNAFARVFDAVSLTSGNNCVYSVFVKKSGSHDFASIRVAGTDVGGFGQTGSNYTFTFSTETLSNDGGGTATSTFVENYGSGWYRIGMEVTNSTITQVNIYPKFNSFVAGEILMWGAQLEEGGYATSYIPTEGSSVRRSKDNVDTNYGDINSLSGEVSVYFNLLPQVSAASNNNKCLSFGFNSSDVNNSYANLRFGTTNWASRIQGTTGNNFNDLGVDKTTEIKAVMVLEQSGYRLYANGSTAVSSGSYGGTAPTINSVAYVQILNDTEDRGIYRIKELKVYNTALTATEAINLTS